MKNFLKVLLVGTILIGAVDAKTATVTGDLLDGIGDAAKSGISGGKNAVIGSAVNTGKNIAKKGINTGVSAAKKALSGGGGSTATKAATGVATKAATGAATKAAASSSGVQLQLGNQGTPTGNGIPTNLAQNVTSSSPIGTDVDVLRSFRNVPEEGFSGLLDSVNDKGTQSISYMGTEWTRLGEDKWIQTKAGGFNITTNGANQYISTKTGTHLFKDGEIVTNWKEGQMYSGAGQQTGWTESGGKIYKDGFQIIETNDIGEITNVSYDVKLSDGAQVNVGDTVYSNGGFSKVTGINADGSLKLENGATIKPTEGLSTFQSKSLNGGDVTYAQGADGKTVVGSDGSVMEYKDGKWEQTKPPSEELAAEQKGEAKGKTGEAKDKAKEAKSPIDTANVTNAIQYAILILQSVEGMNQEDATREVTVKGAEKLKDSQGQSADSTIATGTTLDGSTISCAANSMAYVLQNNTVDLGLLDLSEFDLSVKREHDVARSNRDLLLQQYGVSAQVIAEASNSVSSQFYERTSALTEAAGTTSGSLGAASVVNDSERYPYFEMVRQAALSTVQLGLKGASILPDIQIIDVNAAERDSNDDS